MYLSLSLWTSEFLESRDFIFFLFVSQDPAWYTARSRSSNLGEKQIMNSASLSSERLKAQTFGVGH